VHLRLTVVVFLAAVLPLTVQADQGGPLAAAPVVQLEGGLGRQVAAAQEAAVGDMRLQAPQQPLPPVAVTQLDTRQAHPVLDSRNPPLTLSFADPVPVRDVLLSLVQGTNLSVIPDPGIDDTWVGEIKDVTIREALDLVLEPLGLDYSIRGNIIRVFERELEMRLFNIDYVITQRGGSRGMSASSGGSGGSSASTGGGGGGASGGAAGGGSSSGGGGSTGGGGGSGGSSATVGGSDAPDVFGGIENAVEQLLSPDGTMTLDRTAGLMRVTDRTSRLDAVEQYLEAVMLRVKRQVRLEARVIEVALNESFSAGINWNALIGSLSKYVSIGQTLMNTGGGFTITGNVNDDFGAVLSAFSEQGNATVLSSPSVITMNNQPAVMNAGTQEAFFTTTTQRDPQGVITQATVTPQLINVGVVLSVTPQISADGIITLSLNPSVTEHTGNATSRLGDVFPILSQRTTDTIVQVRDGETIVIAGLMQDKINTSNSSVPVLGSLPLIGGAFRSTTKSKTKTDLVIMLTPTLMGPSEVVFDTAREIRRIDAAQRAKGKRQ
jgi:MSHA biogenesis protein MshL